MGGGIGPTTVVHLSSGPVTLEIEQAADLEAMVERAITQHTRAPYWAYVWPAARALVEAIGHMDLAGCRALDLGAGLGPVAVAAALRGATVVAGDIQPEALEMIRANAARNGVQVETLLLDWDHPPEELGRFDRVFAADVLYEDGMLAGVLRFLRGHLTSEGSAQIADPMRARPSGMEGAARLAGFELETEVLVESERLNQGVNLFTLRRRRSRLGARP